MPPASADSLGSALAAVGGGGVLHGLSRSQPLAELAMGSSLGGRLEDLRGRSVVLAVGDQLAAALSLVELDGWARRLVLCPPDVADEHLAYVATLAEADAVVIDGAREG